MTKAMLRMVLAALPVLTLTTAAHAVLYTLPSGPDVVQAKLSGPFPSYAVACDSRSGVPCDVEPGTYQLQTFDQSWRLTQRNVVIEADTLPSPTSIQLVTEICEFTASNPFTRCTAACPTGSATTGGACLTELVGGRRPAPPVSIPSTADTRSYTCHMTAAASNSFSDRHPNTGETIFRDARIVASAYCMTER